MISVLVQRAPGDFRGEDISDPLISTEAQAIARGTAEINKNCSNRVLISGSCPFHTWMQPGSIVEVTNMRTGTYRAMLRSYAVTIEIGDGEISAITDVVLEKEA